MIEIRAVSQFIENRSLTIVLNYTFEKTKKQKQTLYENRG